MANSILGGNGERGRWGGGGRERPSLPGGKGASSSFLLPYLHLIFRGKNFLFGKPHISLFLPHILVAVIYLFLLSRERRRTGNEIRGNSRLFTLFCPVFLSLHSPFLFLFWQSLQKRDPHRASRAATPPIFIRSPRGKKKGHGSPFLPFSHFVTRHLPSLPPPSPSLPPLPISGYERATPPSPPIPKPVPLFAQRKFLIATPPPPLFAPLCKNGSG